MDSIQHRFDHILSDHLLRLLGTQSEVADLPINFLNISLVIFLAEQAANERDQMISAGDRYTRRTLRKELADIGLGSKSQFYHAIDDMLKRAYIYEDDAGGLKAGAALLKMAQLLDLALPKMPGLNLVAYVAQTLDEAVSGRKALEDAESQFDQTLTLQGVSLSDTPERFPGKEKRVRQSDDKNDKDALSPGTNVHLIKSRRRELGLQSERRSKIISSDSPTQLKTVAFGKGIEKSGARPQDHQHEVKYAGASEAEMDATNNENKVISEATVKDDSGGSADESVARDNQDSEKSLPANDWEDIPNSVEESAKSESANHLLDVKPSDKTTSNGEIGPDSKPSIENPQATQEKLEFDTAKADQLDPIDEVIEAEINKFETDLAMQCPICTSSQIVSEVTTKGKTYYKCPNKSCNFISWGKPFHTDCPRCHNPFLIEAQKNGTTILKCPRATCNYWQGQSETQCSPIPKSTAHIHPSKSKTGTPKRRRRVVKRRVVRRKK